jgi:hypothetical protein
LQARPSRAQLKFGEAPTHLIFDNDGVAYEAIEMKAVEEIFDAGDAKSVGVALKVGRTFGEKKRLKMSGVDKKDKAGAKDKRMEKKRKRKVAARLVSLSNLQF